eukprot:1191430-Prorocentrum_minimum.AAC.5
MANSCRQRGWDEADSTPVRGAAPRRTPQAALRFAQGRLARPVAPAPGPADMGGNRMRCVTTVPGKGFAPKGAREQCP